MNDRCPIETLKNVKLLSKEMARSLCGLCAALFDGYQGISWNCSLQTPRCFLKFRFRLLSNLMHIHTCTFSLSHDSSSFVWRLGEKKEREKRGKKKGLEKKADRWKRFNYRAHPLTGGGSLFAAGDRKWKSLCKWRASLLRKRYFEDRVERDERIEKEKEDGGKSGKGRKRFRGCVAVSCNRMLPMKFRPCVSTSSFSVLPCIYIYICMYVRGEIIFRRSSSSTSLS